MRSWTRTRQPVPRGRPRALGRGGIGGTNDPIHLMPAAVMRMNPRVRPRNQCRRWKAVVGRRDADHVTMTGGDGRTAVATTHVAC